MLQILLVAIIVFLFKYMEYHSVTKIVKLENSIKATSNSILFFEIYIVAMFSRLFNKTILIRINLALIVLYFIYVIYSTFMNWWLTPIVHVFPPEPMREINLVKLSKSYMPDNKVVLQSMFYRFV